jgi:hypothetical protein
MLCRCTVFLGLGFFALAGTRTTAAQTAPAASDADAGPVAFDVRPWLAGWYDPGQWVALDAAVTNSGPNVDAELQATAGGQGVSVVPVGLPTGADKHVPVLVRPTGENVQVSLKPNGRVANAPDTRRVALRVTRDERLVAVLGSDGRKIPGLEGLGGGQPVEQIFENVESLPESALALGSMDALILVSPDLSRANDAQREAVRQWVGLGGHLVIAGTPNLPAVLDALPEPMRPATASGSVDAPLLGESLGAGILDTHWQGGGPIARLSAVPDAEVRASSGNAPTVVAKNYGAGRVTVLAFDPTEPPVSQWGELDKLWDMLAWYSSSGWDQPVPDTGQLVAGLAEQQTTPLPSVGWALLLLGAYVLLVGPVNYLWLRHRRRLDLAWVTIPAITLMTTLITYGVGVSLHGVDVVTRQLSVARVVPEAGVARVTTVVSIFSPGARSYDVALADAYAYPVEGDNQYGPGLNNSGPLRAIQGPGAGVDELSAAQWTSVGFAADAVIPWAEGDMGEARRAGTQITGVVRNAFGEILEGAQVLVPRRVEAIGDMAQGREAPLPTALNGPALVVTLGSDWGESSLFQGALGRVVDENGYYGYSGFGNGNNMVVARPVNNEVVLFGFSNKAPVPADVKGFGPADKVRTLLFGRVPVEGSDSRRITEATVVNAASGASCGQTGSAVSEGEAIFQVSAPQLWSHVEQANTHVEVVVPDQIAQVFSTVAGTANSSSDLIGVSSGVGDGPLREEWALPTPEGDAGNPGPTPGADGVGDPLWLVLDPLDMEPTNWSFELPRDRLLDLADRDTSMLLKLDTRAAFGLFASMSLIGPEADRCWRVRLVSDSSPGDTP